MSWGDPVGLSVHSLAQWDLEVGIHGIVDVPIWCLLVSLGISLDGRLKPFDLIFKGKHGEAVDFFTILDGLDQTGCDLLEGFGVDMGVAGEYVFHSTRGVTGWG